MCVCFRYYRGVVQDTSSEEYYVVSFDDGTYCDNLPPSDIVVSYFMGRGNLWLSAVVVSYLRALCHALMTRFA